MAGRGRTQAAGRGPGSVKKRARRDPEIPSPLKRTRQDTAADAIRARSSVYRWHAQEAHAPPTDSHEMRNPTARVADTPGLLSTTSTRSKNVPISDIVERTVRPIVELEVDAIVNAANERLAGGGGVCGVIFKTAGPDLIGACQALGGCPVGGARLTQAYRLPAKFIIHAVGRNKDQPI